MLFSNSDYAASKELVSELKQVPLSSHFKLLSVVNVIISCSRICGVETVCGVLDLLHNLIMLHVLHLLVGHSLFQYGSWV
jgi:hypothetical protein